MVQSGLDEASKVVCPSSTDDQKGYDGREYEAMLKVSTTDHNKCDNTKFVR